VEGNYENSFKEIIQVIHNKKNVNRTLLEEIHQTKYNIDILDIPSILFNEEPLEMAFVELKKNNKIKSRYITKVTKDNIEHIKQLISLIDEVRHLDEINGNFLINETTFASIYAIKRASAEPLTQLITSNFKSFIEQQQFVFNLLWDKSIPVLQKIKELEEGKKETETVIKTEVVTEHKEIIKKLQIFTRAQMRLNFVPK
jgi:hypothetical protein